MLHWRADVWKEGDMYIIEIPAINASTQGISEIDAVNMMIDWIQSAVNDPYFRVDYKRVPNESVVFSVRPTTAIQRLLKRGLNRES